MPLNTSASVASFFLSRIDSAVDKDLDARGTGQALRGCTAIACAKTAYEVFEKIGASERWARLAELGARPQRLLWASTSTKDPAYSDVMYVEHLIGPQTVNTLPPKTLEAYRDHGKPDRRIDRDRPIAKQLVKYSSIHTPGLPSES